MNSEFTRKQSALASVIREPNDTGDKSCVPQRKILQKVILMVILLLKQCLYSYANKELKSCDPSCRG